MKEFSDFIEDYGTGGDYNLDPQKLSDRQKLLNRCKERCLYLITDSEKTESKLREKLKRSGKYDEEIIEETMSFLKQYGYLDDLRFARRLIQQYSSTKSIKEIEQKLYQRGVGSKDIKTAIAEYQEGEDSEEAELRVLRRLIEKKCRDPLALDRDAKRKLYASLMRKGFSYAMVTKALNVDEYEI